MNAEQKQRAVEFINDWKSDDGWDCAGDQMAALLQELVDAPEVEPVARVTSYYAGYLSIATVDGRVLPSGTALYTAPPASSVPDEELQAAFDRGLKAGNELKDAQQVEIHRLHGLLAATPTQPEPPAELPTWENGDDPLVGGGLISRGVVDFATVGIWPTKPAPSVPDGWMRAIDEALVVHHIDIADSSDGYEEAKKKLNELLAINSDIARDCSEAPADPVRDAERLDWLTKKCTHLESEAFDRIVTITVDARKKLTKYQKFDVRAAIDAAIERQGGES